MDEAPTSTVDEQAAQQANDRQVLAAQKAERQKQGGIAKAATTATDAMKTVKEVKKIAKYARLISIIAPLIIPFFVIATIIAALLLIMMSISDEKSAAAPISHIRYAFNYAA